MSTADFSNVPYELEFATDRAITDLAEIFAKYNQERVGHRRYEHMQDELLQKWRVMVDALQTLADYAASGAA